MNDLTMFFVNISIDGYDLNIIGQALNFLENNLKIGGQLNKNFIILHSKQKTISFFWKQK